MSKIRKILVVVIEIYLVLGLGIGYLFGELIQQEHEDANQ